MKKIVLQSWKEVDGLTPIVGTTVVIIGSGNLLNPEGRFTWALSWNPFVGRYQLVRI